MSAKKSEAKGTVRGGYAALPWGKLKDLFDLMQQFGPMAYAMLLAAWEIFSKKEMKGLKEDLSNVGDCCPNADAVADKIVAKAPELNVLALKIKGDPCNEELCKEFNQFVAECFALSMALHCCHKD